MALLIKICGLKTPEALEVSLESGADMVGFVFFGPSPRNLSPKAAQALETQVRGRALRVAVVRSRFGLPVMKALPIATRADLSPIRLYAKVADRLLFDARAPLDATRPGGLGKPFDWT